MKKVVRWASDSRPPFDRALRVAVASFLEFNEGWQPFVHDVGLHPREREWLARRGVAVLAAEPSPDPQMAVTVIPTARCRLLMLADLPDDTLLLYMDVDGATFHPAAAVVERFLAQDCPLALLPEVDRRFFRVEVDAGCAWDGGYPPESYFPERWRWARSCMINSGMILARGCPWVREFGRLALEVYHNHRHQLCFGEQSILTALLHERRVPFHRFHPHEHCCLWDYDLCFSGPPWADMVYCDGEPVVFRHFCSIEAKPLLVQALPALERRFLGAGATTVPLY